MPPASASFSLALRDEPNLQPLRRLLPPLRYNRVLKVTLLYICVYEYTYLHVIYNIYTIYRERRRHKRNKNVDAAC